MHWRILLKVSSLFDVYCVVDSYILLLYTTAVLLRGLKGFDWDVGNRTKNEKKHGVTSIECEEIFFNRPLIMAKAQLVAREERFAALGRTHGGRLLFVVLTIRKDRIRVISARPMSRKERKLYEKEVKT
ncbi:MAG: BrnT family toxin [Deltaproteobacteria bacterium]|nr:BrnT family toxin [Deltaproteobacteria bacterium]